MGMDLKPMRPTKDAPRYPKDYNYAPLRGKVMYCHYNWGGWSWLISHLGEWGVDLHEFSGMNDGEIISNKTCLKVAEAMESHLEELIAEGCEEKVVREDIILWRTCGGYRQY